LTYDEAEAAAPVEKRQAAQSEITVDAALASTGDFAFSHELLQRRRIEAKAPSDQACIDLDGPLLKHDLLCHRTK
jgi:hypothetical protein